LQSEMAAFAMRMSAKVQRGFSFGMKHRSSNSTRSCRADMRTAEIPHLLAAPGIPSIAKVPVKPSCHAPHVENGIPYLLSLASIIRYRRICRYNADTNRQFVPTTQMIILYWPCMPRTYTLLIKSRTFLKFSQTICIRLSALID
jgi:hypothetical protein